MVYGKGGPYGSSSKRRVVPLSNRIGPLIDGHFAVHEKLSTSPRIIQRLIKRVANRASSVRTAGARPQGLPPHIDFAFDRVE